MAVQILKYQWNSCDRLDFVDRPRRHRIQTVHDIQTMRALPVDRIDIEALQRLSRRAVALENWSEEGDVLELFNALGLGVRTSAVQEAELFDGELRRTRVASRRPFAYLVRRGAAEGSLDTGLLARARELRDKAAALGDQPYGAIVVRDGIVVGEGRNQVITLIDPTA